MGSAVMTDKPKTWGEMTDAEKGALLLADHDGKEIEVWLHYDRWEKKHNGGRYIKRRAYRVSPEPVRETVTMYGSLGDGLMLLNRGRVGSDTHTLTYDIVDGEIDCASVRMERIK